jgi:hypothetical protein
MPTEKRDTLYLVRTIKADGRLLQAGEQKGEAAAMRAHAAAKRQIEALHCGRRSAIGWRVEVYRQGGGGVLGIWRYQGRRAGKPAWKREEVGWPGMADVAGVEKFVRQMADNDLSESEAFDEARRLAGRRHGP